MHNTRKPVSIAFGACLAALFQALPIQAANVWAVNARGDITLNGAVFRVKGGSWFGLEGRHEPSSDPTNPGGAPMEMYLGNMFWSESGRTLRQDALEIKKLGFNSVRIPVVPQTLSDNDPQGKSPNLKNAPSVRIEGAYSALKQVVRACSDAGLYVLLDLHSCSNYVGWRKGRLDARPPYVDATRPGYDFKREEYSCSETGNPASVKRIHAYNTSKWLADLRKLAGLSAEIGVDNVMGIDIFNEPWDYGWEEWRTMIDQAYGAINPVNPNILIYAQGIGGNHGSQDGTPHTKSVSPHGDTATNPNWGENLFEAGLRPPAMPKSKLVFSPHTYGPAVFEQKMFADPAQPECAGAEGEGFAEKKCRIVINQARLDAGWHEHFGYLKSLGYAIAVGEFGGNMDWPAKTNPRTQSLYGYLTDRSTDEKWQNAFVDYMNREGIHDSFYWSINPESGDTYGIFKSPYDPVSNRGGWGTWGEPDSRKMRLLEKLWAAPRVEKPGEVGGSTRVSRKDPGFRMSGNRGLDYTLDREAFVSVRLHNLDGSLHSDLVGARQAAGSYSVDLGRVRAGPGLYLAVLTTDGDSRSRLVRLSP